MPSHPWSLMLSVLLLALGATSTGCDDTGDDDDDVADDDDDTGDDDTGDDDSAATDDDDDPNGGGTLETTGADPCGPVASAWHIEHVASNTYIRGVYASTEDHTCDSYTQWDAATGAAWDAFDPAWISAQDARDPTAACQAAQAYYTALQAAEDAIRPPGSCTMYLRPSQYEPGNYFPDGEADEDFNLELWYPQSSFYGAILQELGDCSGWSDWDTWAVWFGNVEQAGLATRVVWEVTEGTLTIGDDGGVLTLRADDLTIEESDGAGTGTLSLDLRVQYCEI